MTHFLKLLIVLLLTVQTIHAENSPISKKPNFIIIFADDLGYGDLGVFGSTNIRTPHLDQMAKEGRKFTSFMVASSVCSPSRAALLTGSYPKRINLEKGVLFPTSTTGINPEEFTIADLLKNQGYKTTCIGKWHLGHHKETLPNQLGFDTYFGIPYSNDMNHPANHNKPPLGVNGLDELWKSSESTLTKWQTPLMENDKIIELPVDQRTITRRYTDRAISFIKDNQQNPFFIYLPHSMPHIPLYVPDDVRNPDPKMAYINVIEHLDTEIGRIFTTLKELKLDSNTYVIFTSDNGPWLTFKHHAGSAGPLRDGKMSTFEGGQRVPCIIWAPGKIPANSVCHELLSSIDLLPTIAKLTNTSLPEKNSIDGLDVSVLLNSETKSPRQEFLYYSPQGMLVGIRQDDWKFLSKDSKGKNKEKNNQSEGNLLFNLKEDLGEKNNLAESNAELVEKLKTRMKTLDAEISASQRPLWRKNN